MKFNPVITEYYNVFIDQDSDAANRMLSCISGTGISLIAYKSKYVAGEGTVFTLFSLKTDEMIGAVTSKGYRIDGPYPGLFVEGDDIPGALAEIFQRLADRNIIINESSGIANINNGYGVVLYVPEKDIATAYTALLE